MATQLKETQIENTQPKREKSSTGKIRDRSGRKEKAKPLTKVVVRRLPPSMTEETFLKQVEPLPDHDSFYFVNADWSLGHEATCRAYIQFAKQEDIFMFKDQFDGYVFVDNKGAEYPAIVEFAPFQGLPRNKSRKKDPKCATIETDPHFIAFMEALNSEEAEGKAEMKMEYSFQLKDDKKITNTPLLQYIANKKQERRDERKRKLDEKRRQRDEEKQKKKIQIAKNIPQAIKEEDVKESYQKDKSIDKDDKDSKDKEGNARSRRRLARELRRKQERERRAQDNTDKGTENRKERNGNESAEQIDGQKFKEDSKKYSESRRDKRRAKSEQKKIDSHVEPLPADAEKENSQSSENSTSVNATSNNPIEVNEVVLEFIKSVANIREFVPRNRESAEKPSSSGEKSDQKLDIDASNLEEVSETLNKTDDNDSHDKKPSERNSQKDSSPRNDRRKDDKTSRRIRNKDRPSMEIYQPGKTRLSGRKEDGRSSTELKDYKSNPTSDCESVKNVKDETSDVRKKVSRYSERRSNRVKGKEDTKKESTSPDIEEEAKQATECKTPDINPIENATTNEPEPNTSNKEP